MIFEAIKYKGRVWARAAGDAGRFVRDNKISSAASAIVLTIVAHFLIFGEAEGFSIIRSVVSLLVGGLGYLSAVFLWSLFWAPFQMERDSAAEWEMIIENMHRKIAALRNANSGFKNRLIDRNNNVEAIDRLEKLFREGEAILRQHAGGFEKYIGWRERVSSWNESVQDALPKSEQFGFESIAEWAELAMPAGKLKTSGAINGHMRNGKAYMHTKMIKLRKIIMHISGM